MKDIIGSMEGYKIYYGIFFGWLYRGDSSFYN